MTNYEINSEQTDNAARLAGDEFVVILTELSTPLDANIVAVHILTMFHNGFDLEGYIYPAYVSTAISLCPNNTESTRELPNFADAAMYQAKHKGNNCVEFLPIISPKL